MNFCLVLEYDGSGFEGWQIQSGDARTVQGCLKDAAEIALELINWWETRT